jgi:hypothetical protein
MRGLFFGASLAVLIFAILYNPIGLYVARDLSDCLDQNEQTILLRQMALAGKAKDTLDYCLSEMVWSEPRQVSREDWCRGLYRREPADSSLHVSQRLHVQGSRQGLFGMRSERIQEAKVLRAEVVGACRRGARNRSIKEMTGAFSPARAGCSRASFTQYAKAQLPLLSQGVTQGVAECLWISAK